jgi:hypothetical protein
VTDVEQRIWLEHDRLVLTPSKDNTAVMRRAAGDLAVALDDKRANSAWPAFRSPMNLFPEAYDSRRDQKDRDTPPNDATTKAAVANYLTAVQYQIVVTLRPELIGVGPE